MHQGLVLVLRKGKVLARPQSDDRPVPRLEDIADFITIIESQEHEGITVVNSSIGQAPEGWRWIDVIDLQSEVNNDEYDGVLGEAILCA